MPKLPFLAAALFWLSVVGTLIAPGAFFCYGTSFGDRFDEVAAYGEGGGRSTWEALRMTFPRRI